MTTKHFAAKRYLAERCRDYDRESRLCRKYNERMADGYEHTATVYRRVFLWFQKNVWSQPDPLDRLYASLPTCPASVWTSGTRDHCRRKATYQYCELYFCDDHEPSVATELPYADFVRAMEKEGE